MSAAKKIEPNYLTVIHRRDQPKNSTSQNPLYYSPFGVLLYERDYTKQVCTTIEIQVEQFIIDESYDSGLDPLNWSTTANTVASIGSGTLNMSKPLGSGLYEITRTVSLEAGVDYTYSFEYAIDGLGNNRGIQCEITDLTTANVVYTSGYIDVLGNYSTSFTAPTTGNYQVRFFARKANGSTNGFNINHTFSLDNIVLSYIEDQEQTTCDDYDCDYRYAFQGQEKDDEVKGRGNSYNYSYRMHDTRLGRFFAIDPLKHKYPFYSPYAFSGNEVISKVEIEGLEPAYVGIGAITPRCGKGNERLVYLKYRTSQSDKLKVKKVLPGKVFLFYQAISIRDDSPSLSSDQNMTLWIAESHEKVEAEIIVRDGKKYLESTKTVRSIKMDIGMFGNIERMSDGGYKQTSRQLVLREEKGGVVVSTNPTDYQLDDIIPFGDKIDVANATPAEIFARLEPETQNATLTAMKSNYSGTKKTFGDFEKVMKDTAKEVGGGTK